MGAVVNSSPVATFSDLVQGASDRSEEAAAERHSEDHGDVDRILHLLPDVLGAGRRVSHV